MARKRAGRLPGLFSDHPGSGYCAASRKQLLGQRLLLLAWRHLLHFVLDGAVLSAKMPTARMPELRRMHYTTFAPLYRIGPDRRCNGCAKRVMYDHSRRMVGRPFRRP